MALTKGDRLRVKMMYSGSIPMLKMYEASGETFMAGDLLTAASGAASLATTSNAVDVVGIAISSGQNHASDNVATGQMVPLVRGVLIEGSITGASHATLTLQSTHMYHGGFLKRATSGVWGIDLGSSTSSATIRVVGFKDATGTQHGRVFVAPTTLLRHAIWQ